MEAFSIQELYDKYGITAYSLACQGQSTLISYYWLKEELQTQHLKAVVFDTYGFFSKISGGGSLAL